MHNTLIQTQLEGTRSEFLRLLADQDSPPAFVLRAQRVEAAWISFLRLCERDRRELLSMSRMRLGQLGCVIAHDWDRLRPFLVDDHHVGYLEELHSDWKPELRAPPSPSTSLRKIRSCLRELNSSFDRFNPRWQKYIEELDLTPVNWERHEYNEYYLIEKAAAFGSERVAALGFERLPDLTANDVVEALPHLQIPSLR